VVECSPGMSRSGTHLSRAPTAAAARSGRIGSAGGIDGIQPLVRVIKTLVSGDAHMDSFASALRLLRCALRLHLLQETRGRLT
jgi:hypothetical protein